MRGPETLEWVAVSPLPLDVDALSAWATRPECGAVVTFCGNARATAVTGHEIVELDYDADVALAEARIREVTAAARDRWPEVVAIAIHHRVGRVAVREPAVVIVVASPHRREAFEAARFCIDAVKSTVPLWKREVWRDGSAWSAQATAIRDVGEL
ncbi:MAG: molybdenum cofactor biosynthesis protein MoaE [Acidimicrobiales bacterium]